MGTAQFVWLAGVFMTQDLVALINRNSPSLDVLGITNVEVAPEEGDSIIVDGAYFTVSHREFELVNGWLVLRRIYLFIPFAAEDAALSMGEGETESAGMF